MSKIRMRLKDRAQVAAFQSFYRYSDYDDFWLRFADAIVKSSDDNCNLPADDQALKSLLRKLNQKYNPGKSPADPWPLKREKRIQQHIERIEHETL